MEGEGKEVGLRSQDRELGLEKVSYTPSIALSASASRQDSDPNPYGSRPECFKSTLQECLFVLTTTLATGQSSIFIGATISMTSYIGRDLNMSSAEVTWITASQSLSAGCFLLFFGKVADLFGRRRMFLVSMASFSACLLITGFATNAIYMDVFCGLMGLSSAAAVPPAIGILGAAYSKPSRRKNRAFACFSAGNPLGFVAGALVAGIANHVSGWRAAFWALTVIYGIFTVTAWWTVPEDESETRLKFNLETLSQFDFLGTLLVVSGIAMFTSALTMAADAPKGWGTSYIIALLVFGIVFLVAFVYWQSIFKHPLMPLTVWKDRNFTLLVSILCLGFYGFANNIFWLSLFWQRTQSLSPLEVALRILPQAVCGVIVNIVAAVVMHRVSNKLLMAVGALSFVLSFALMSARSENSSYWAFIFPAMVFSVVGADLEFTVTNMYVMSSLPPSQQSVAGGLLTTVTRLSASAGLGISTAVYAGILGPDVNNTASRYRPYQATFWVGLAGAVLSVFFLPFLTIKKQGSKKR